VVVEAQDAFGNLTPAFTGAVRVALEANGLGATAAGTMQVNAAGGVATFGDLTVNRAGAGYALVASAAGVPAIVSAQFDISHGAAAALIFGRQPSSGVAGASIAPAITVSVQDAYGNPVTTSSDAITLALGANPAAGRWAVPRP